MRITQKVSLALSFAFVILCALLWAALQWVVAPQFVSLELERAESNFGRAQNAIERELSQLDAYRHDYGVWDDAYEFVSGNYPGFIEDGLPISVLSDLNVDIFIFLKNDGTIIHAFAWDDDTGKEISRDALAPSVDGGWSSFARGLRPDDAGRALIQTHAGPMLAAYAPVAKNDETGEYKGHILTGKLMDESYLDVLREYTRVDIRLLPADALAENSRQHVSRANGFVSVFGPIAGVDGAPAGMLVARTPCQITALGQKTLLSAFLWLSAVALAFIALVSFLLRRITIKPIERLNALMLSSNAEKRAHDERLARRNDEIGDLYASFTGLFGRVGERTRELASALDAAEAGERAKSQFLANMSHEIRTPMNGVMGMADLLAATKLSETQRTFVDVIVKSGDALLTIINDILDFSKLDAGMTVLHPAPFRLRDIVEDASALIAPRAASKDVEVAVRVDPKLPEMFVGDAGRLRQILVNLASNAVKFTDKGHILIDVTAASDDTDSRVALNFSVEDTGIGIPEAKRALIFEKFNQADTSSTRAHEGTGLGLAIAKALVELMGGQIGVESEVGVGSCFKFTVALPVGREEDEKRLPPPEIVSARMLVIDDNEINRLILEEQAAAWGFDCVSRSSGAAGIETLRAAETDGDPFDIVIMDFHMPEMDGAETVRVIREDRNIGRTPIVMLTSVDDTSDRVDSISVEAHLTKPVRSAALLRAIAASMRRAERDTAGATEAPASEPAQKKAAPTGRIDVLVAEDNEVNRMVVGHILDNAGLSYEMAENGREAVRKFIELRPRLILMDVSMPEMNGFEATAQIRSMEAAEGAHTPIIGVTAHAVNGDRENCLQAGMDDYVAKPVSPQKLSEKIRQYLGPDAADAA
ncbi:MAG: response regulator [Parvularculaceae bacterium]